MTCWRSRSGFGRRGPARMDVAVGRRLAARPGRSFCPCAQRVPCPPGGSATVSERPRSQLKGRTMSLQLLAADVVNVLAALPDPDPVAPPGFEAVGTILGWAKWVGLIAAILALIAVAVMFMFNSRRGEGGEHVKTFVAILVGVMVIGAATALAATMNPLLRKGLCESAVLICQSLL